MFLEASVDTGSCEKCFICIVIITRTSAPGCIYILMFYSSPLSNAPLNYTERRQCQTPIVPNLLLHCVKQKPSNLVYLITAYKLITALTLWNIYDAFIIEHFKFSKPQFTPVCIITCRVNALLKRNLSEKSAYLAQQRNKTNNLSIIEGHLVS